jgi:hypothetical protein
MKNIIKFKKKLFFGIFTALLAIIAIIIAMPTSDEIPFPETLEIQTELEAQIEPEAENFEVSPPVITTNPPITTPAPVEITPILAEEPIFEEISVQEEPIIEIIESSLTPQPTQPPQEPQTPPAPVISQVTGIQGNGYSFYRRPDGRLNFDWMVAPCGEVISYNEYVTRMKTNPPKPDEVHGTDEHGNLYKVVDGQKYVWHDILGWGLDNGMGTVTIMDAQSDGHRFFTEPCGTVNLSKIVTPTGEIISYEEYQRRKGIVPQLLPIFEFEDIPWYENEQYYKFENGERYIWDSALGWGTDTLSSGQDVFIEIDGEFFTWEEYVEIMESR